VIARIDIRGRSADGIALNYRHVVPRADFDVAAAAVAVGPLCEDVRVRGDEAVRDLARTYDGVELGDIRVDPELATRAAAAMPEDLRAALTESIRRVRETCARELDAEPVTELGPGATVTRRLVPMGRVGLYVPAGITPLPSSVVMNVVPAQVAGVRSIAVASSPQKDHDGLPHPSILGVLGLLGVDEIYAAGGSAAVPMFAYGTQSCARVDIVCGPGNIYTVAAKRVVSAVVAIDSEAGPTEILVVADGSADAGIVAADLVSQAEHDPSAAAVLVTDSQALAEAVKADLEARVPATRHAARVATALRGRQSAIVLVDDLDQAVEVANGYASEHTEVQTVDAEAVADRITAAGALFVGRYTPVSLGDYCAGSNHVLPTGGCACFSSGLSVRTFLRSMQQVRYSRDALAQVADAVRTLADAEDLPAHGGAVTQRFAQAPR